MQTVVGIICEYDPFHLGHKRQFELIRQQLPDARIVCLMSGCFTQRGMPALHTPHARAKAALNAGADAVFELPCAFAVRDAEHFALGGVEILTQLGFVTHLSFGAEDDIALLQPAAELLENPTELFTKALKEKLAQGLSFAAAQGAALDACFPLAGSPWSKPNNILALCYLRAIARLHSPLIALPVLRKGDYHASELSANEWPSASAVRAAFLKGAAQAAQAACGYALPASPVCRPDALDMLLLYKLRSAAPAQLRSLPDCTEGLEHRLKACAMEAVSREALLEAVKTRRYAHARLSRLCAHALLDIAQDFLHAHPHPVYVRLLGLRRSDRELTAAFRQSQLPVISKPTEDMRSHPLFLLDERAYDLWALGAGMPHEWMFRQSMAAV